MLLNNVPYWATEMPYSYISKDKYTCINVFDIKIEISYWKKKGHSISSYNGKTSNEVEVKN